MNTPTEESMFEITLSQEGAGYLLRIFKIARWLLGIASFASIVYTSLSLLRFIALKKYDTGGTLLSFIQFKLEPCVLAIAGILTFLQVFYYFRFATLCKKSIVAKQTEVFNSSFKWLFRYAALTLFLFTLNVITGVFYIYLLVSTILKASNPA